jgi:hypothetical protein
MWVYEKGINNKITCSEGQETGAIALAPENACKKI